MHVPHVFHYFCMIATEKQHKSISLQRVSARFRAYFAVLEQQHRLRHKNAVT